MKTRRSNQQLVRQGPQGLPELQANQVSQDSQDNQDSQVSQGRQVSLASRDSQALTHHQQVPSIVATVRTCRFNQRLVSQEPRVVLELQDSRVSQVSRVRRVSRVSLGIQALSHHLHVISLAEGTPMKLVLRAKISRYTRVFRVCQENRVFQRYRRTRL